MLRISLAAFHLLALAIGLGAVLMRASALQEPASQGSMRRAFRADSNWGIAAGLWVVTGLWRYLGGIEKGTPYYNGNHIFLAKMSVFVLIVALEISPMVTLIKWRTALAKGAAPEAVAVPGMARRIATISRIQAVLVALMVFLAVSMARGYGSH